VPDWQVRFDRGHQQRYLPDRAAVLRYALGVGPGTASSRFAVYEPQSFSPTSLPAEACWGLNELYATTSEPSARDALLRALGLLEQRT
jgi:hypothetical protein